MTKILTTFIEIGFQKQLKTGAVFLDRLAVYDMVWHTGLLVKVFRVVPRWAVEAVELLLRDRRFRVHMGNRASVWKRQTKALHKALYSPQPSSTCTQTTSHRHSHESSSMPTTSALATRRRHSTSWRVPLTPIWPRWPNNAAGGVYSRA